MLRRQSARAARAVVLSVSLAIVPAASAVTHTWTGGFGFAPSSNMNDSAAWGGTAPTQPPSASSNLELVFPFSLSNGSLSTTPNQNFAPTLRLQHLNIVNPSLYTFSGNGLQFENLGANPSIIFGASGAVTFPLAMTFVAPTKITTGANTVLNLNAPLAGAGGITFVPASGTKLVTIGGSTPNSLAGTHKITDGLTLQLIKGPGNAIGGTIEILDGGYLNAISPNQFSPGSHVKMSSTTTSLPTYIMSGPQTLAQLTIDAGIANLNGATLTVQSAITSNGGAVQIADNFNPSSQLNLNAGLVPITVNGTGPTDMLTITAPIANGTFAKLGPGTLRLTGTNTFTSPSQINAGTVQANPQSIGDVVNNGILDFINPGIPHTGNISGTGSVRISETIILAGTNSYTGGTVINTMGQLAGNTNSLVGSISEVTGATVYVDQSFNGTLNATLNGAIALEKTGTGVVSLGPQNHTFGTNLAMGGLRLLSDASLGTFPFSWGTMALPVTLEAVGSRTIANVVSPPGAAVSIEGSGDLAFVDTSPKSFFQPLTHNSTGSTKFVGKANVGAGAIVVNAGTLTLGDSAVANGFTIAPTVPITVNAGTLTLRSLNFISLPNVTLAGGTLNTPNGYAIPLGAILQGTGGVTGRVASANGSTIIASGNLTLGDAAHPAGVNLDGELYTNQHAVTLADFNQAVLGSLTQLGTPTQDGTLNASAGLVVNFGRNIAGRGTINSSNTLARAVVMNGDVNGDSLSAPIVFTGYVKGVGTFNNVGFGGTFAPGLSPALVTMGSGLFLPSNVLEMEIGGLLRGSQYDAIDFTGTFALDGQLKLVFINGFNPSAGDTFNLFDGTTTGTFSSFNFPSLSFPLYYNTSQLYTQGWVQIAAVPEPTMFVGAMALGAVLRRKRR